MPDGSPDPQKLVQYYTLAQIGVEMAAPIGIGALLDVYLHTMPWLSVVGAVIGLVGGLVHLVAIVNRKGNSRGSKSRQERP